MDALIEYDENEVDALKSQIRELMEGRTGEASHIMALIEVATEIAVDITGSGPEGTSMFLAAVSAVPLYAAEHAGERPEVH